MTYPDSTNHRLFYISTIEGALLQKVEVQSDGTSIIERYINNQATSETTKNRVDMCVETNYEYCAEGIHSFNNFSTNVWDCTFWNAPNANGAPSVFTVEYPCPGGGETNDPGPNDGTSFPPPRNPGGAGGYGDSDGDGYDDLEFYECQILLDCEDCNLPGDLNNDCAINEIDTCLASGNNPDDCIYLDENNNSEFCESRRQCDKINDLLDNYPNFRQELINLSTTVNEDHENAKGIFVDGTTFDESGTALDPYVKLNQNPTSKYIAIAHTHYETATTSGQDTYSVFSPGDLEFFAQRLRENELDNGQFVAFLITGKGTRYALTIRNKNKFLAFFDYVRIQLKLRSGRAATQEEMDYYLNDILPIYYDYFDKEAPNPAPINKLNTNNNLVLQEFLKFIDEANMGAELYTADETFTNFIQVKYDNNEPNNIKEKPCNY